MLHSANAAVREDVSRVLNLALQNLEIIADHDFAQTAIVMALEHVSIVDETSTASWRLGLLRGLTHFANTISWTLRCSV